MPTTIDECQAELHRMGWSIGDVLVRSENGPTWMVFAQRGEHRVVAKAASQADAWVEANRLASIDKTYRDAAFAPSRLPSAGPGN